MLTPSRIQVVTAALNGKQEEKSMEIDKVESYFQ